MESIWFMLIIALLVIEVFTVQFVSLGFACGAALALIACQLGASVLLQATIYIGSSLVFWCLLVKYGRRLIAKNTVKTGASGLVGRQGVVVCRDNALRVLPDGEECDWKANGGDHRLEHGTRVIIKEIQGVTLIVEPVKGSEGECSGIMENERGATPKGA